MEHSVKAFPMTAENEHYIFKLSDKVEREHVNYYTRYGIEIAADLYYAKDIDKDLPHKALVIGPPFGGVKEQGPGVYANQLAQKGFIVLAFDPAYHGFSGGMPRYTGSPDTYVEDFSAAVDFLGTLDFVGREKIGAIGICASGGFALGAARQDTRIKAVVTSVLYDIPSLAGSVKGEERQKQLQAGSEARWTDPEKYQLMYPEKPADKIPANLNPVDAEFFSFYGMKRGWNSHALTNITATSFPSFMSFSVTTHLDSISPRPVLMITSEEAHSKSFTDEVYKKLAEPKEKLVLPHGQHIDFYDNVKIIPFDKISSFFDKNL